MAAKIHTVMVDKGVLEGFKRRALRIYPLEHIEECVGVVDKGTARIHCLLAMHPDKQTVNEVEDAYDSERPRGFLGTIHTHPGYQFVPEASETDIYESHEYGERIAGVCAIAQRKKRRLVSWKFYDTVGREISLVTTE